MSDYTQVNDYSAKDALSTGNPLKIIKGSDIDAELAAISTAIASKYDSTDVASAAEAQAGISNTVVITPGRLTSWAQNGAGVLEDIQTLTDPGADRLLFFDFSAGSGAFLSLSAAFTISGTELQLAGTVTDPVDETRTLTAGNGLSGGGDLSADRTFDLDFNELTGATAAGTDLIAFADVSDSNTVRKATLTDLLGAQGGDLTAGVGLSFSVGTGVNGVASTIDLDIASLTEETNVDFTNDEMVFYDNSAGVERKIAPDDLLGAALGDARYYKSGSQSVTSTPAKVTFGTSTYDELTRGTVASSTYTRGSVAGRIMVHAKVHFSNINDDEYIRLFIYKNGAEYSRVTFYNDTDNDTPTQAIQITDFLSLAASDTVDIYASTTSTSEALTTGSAYGSFLIQELS